MADTNKLKDVVDNIIDDNTTAAEVDFHEYARQKMMELLGRTPTEAQSTDDNEE